MRNLSIFNYAAEGGEKNWGLLGDLGNLENPTPVWWGWGWVSGFGGISPKKSGFRGNKEKIEDPTGQSKGIRIRESAVGARKNRGNKHLRERGISIENASE